MNNSEQIREIYRLSFGESAPFDDEFFSEFGACAKVLEKNGKVVSVLFLLPCMVQTKQSAIDARYIYAAATHPDFRGRGYMSELIEGCCSGNMLYFLKPANEALQRFYERLGFKKCSAVSGEKCNAEIVVSEGQKRLQQNCDCPEKYVLMLKGAELSGEIRFDSPME